MLETVRLELPPAETDSLNCHLPNVLLQIRPKNRADFRLEIVFQTEKNDHKRLIFSANFREIGVTFFHVQVPLPMLEEGVW